MIFNFRKDSYRQTDWLIMMGELVEKDQAKGLLDEIEKSTKFSTSGLIIDLRGMRYMNSCGLNILIRLRGKAIERGKTVALVTGNSNKIHQLLIVSKLKDIFFIASNLDKAIEMLASQKAKAA